MTMAPVRPIFQNGQRLTAERLTEAVEYLRTTLRRVLLGPLSAGVGAGFDVTPLIGDTANELVIQPGIAIDGKGRLIVVPDEQHFSPAEIAQKAGIVFTPGTPPPENEYVRICLALDDSSQSTNPCDPQLPLEIVENFKFRFIKEDLTQAFLEIIAKFQEPNCVQAWQNLDLVPPTDDECCVTIGHVHFVDSTTIIATNFFRQGVSPRFSIIRNSQGVPSIFLSDMRFDPAAFGLPAGTPQEVAAVTIPLNTVFGPGFVFFGGPAGGPNVQATRVGAFAGPAAGAFWEVDPKVFVFRGGSGPPVPPSNFPAQAFAGISAVQAPIVGGTEVARPGVPLAIQDNAAGGRAEVAVFVPGTNPTRALLGISAAQEQTLFGNRLVPVATSGIVEVDVQTTAAISVGDALTASATDAGFLRPATFGDIVIARAALSSPAPSGGATSVTIFAWVVHPAVLVL